MNELIKKVLASDENALDSLDAFASAAGKLGYSQQAIDGALDQLDGFPLDDDQLEEIVGGYASFKPSLQNTVMPKQQKPKPFL